MIQCLSVAPGQSLSLSQDLADRMRAGQLGAVVIERVLAPSTCDAIRHQLLQNLQPVGEPLPRYHTYGEVLLMASSLDTYRAEGRRLTETLASFDVETALLGALGIFGGRWPVSPFVTDHPYALYTVRSLGLNGEIPVHSERADWPLMTAHRERLDLRHQFSFYIPLQLPQGGGELILYEQKPEATLEGLSSVEVEALLGPGGSQTVHVEPGDLLVFDGGRYNHRVTEVTAGPTRWTLGGFLAFDEDQLVGWS